MRGHPRQGRGARRPPAPHCLAARRRGTCRSLAHRGGGGGGSGGGRLWRRPPRCPRHGTPRRAHAEPARGSALLPGALDDPTPSCSPPPPPPLPLLGYQRSGLVDNGFTGVEGGAAVAMAAWAASPAAAAAAPEGGSCGRCCRVGAPSGGPPPHAQRAFQCLALCGAGSVQQGVDDSWGGRRRGAGTGPPARALARGAGGRQRPW